MNAAKSLLIALFLTVTIFAQTDGHNPKLNLDDFEKEYVRIKKACTTIGYCRCHCTKKDGCQRVAFTAGINSSSTTFKSEILVFNNVISNVGNGYNKNTGIFTAPTNGTYVFSVAAVEYRRNFLYWDIVVNNMSKVRLMGDNGGPFNTATNTVVLSLTKNDQVWVKRMRGTGYYSASVPLVTFTGYLI
uniref:C1q-related factor-like n=1 Tax=Crassostrea virginica TaxID=6565 RepID=A0A8B8AXH2_CRAVI|nr:C1q-related factor-like [Crassostrea virginica]